MHSRSGTRIGRAVPAPSRIALFGAAKRRVPLPTLVVRPTPLPDTCQDPRVSGQPMHMETDRGTSAIDLDERYTSMFERHYKEVLAYCARRSIRSEAEDATAEVFAVAWRRIDDIDWDTARPWLYGIARGVMNNRWRSLKRQGRLTQKVASLAPTPSDSPDVVVLRRSQDLEVVGVLETLKLPDQEVLKLAAWEELTAPEIAVVLEISTWAAEQRLHRAKRRFAKKMDHYGPNPHSQSGAAGQRGEG